jgi:hypothetical protein
MLKIYGKEVESCLIIIFSAKDDVMHNILLKTENIKAFPYPNYFNYNISFDKEIIDEYKIELVKSTFCGLGKSEIIKSQITNENLMKKKR